MSSSRCRLIGDQPDDLERALAASGSAGEELLTFFVQNLDDGQCWLFELGVDPLTIGRSAQADMPLSDATVSGRHARLERHPTGLLIKDLRSTNGTFVNEGRVFSQALIQGDVVRCGGVRLRIVVDGVPEPLNQTVRHEETTRIPVMPEQLIEVHQPDGSLSGPARQSLVNAVDRVAQRPPSFLILDLAETKAVSVNALALIADLRQRLKERSGELLLCSMSRRVRDSFELSPQAEALSDVVHSDIDAARQALVRRLSRNGPS